MEVRALSKGVGISPGRMRPVLDAVRGKKVEEALALLKLLATPAARSVAKVVKSAAANAENNYQMSPSGLRIVRIFADEGPRLKRFRPQARGRVSPILRRSSHITVAVEEA